jgi:CubicO group peptidase (beta-lactamase class C family)
MKLRLAILLFLLLSIPHISNSQLYFPPNTGTWETLSPDSLEWCPDKIQELYDFLDSTNSKAFILLKDGKIVLEKYFGNFTVNTPHVWNSAGKTLTAFLVGVAQDENLLSIDDTTSNYLGAGWTSMTTAQEEKITIKHQLTMTTGLDDIDFSCTDAVCLNYLADPGTRWSYHNAPYTLLDGVINAATGQTPSQYFAAKVGAPTGMTGAFFAFGYDKVFISNARSFARFGLLLQADGIWNGAPVLNDLNYLNDMRNTSQSLNPAYGYLTWLNGKPSFMVPGLQLSFPGSMVPNAPSDAYAALGKNSQILNVVPSQGIVFIRMGDGDSISLVGSQYNDSIWIRINDLNCTNTLTEKTHNNDIILYPNPNDGQLRMTGLESNDQLKVVNTLGESVPFSRENDFISISSKGIYFIEIQRSNQKIIKKIVIQ